MPRFRFSSPGLAPTLQVRQRRVPTILHGISAIQLETSLHPTSSEPKSVDLLIDMFYRANIATQYAPRYHQSLEGIFVIFAVYLLLVILQIFNLKRLQRKKERTRVAAGLPEKIEVSSGLSE